MEQKSKKVLYIVGLEADLLVTAFLFGLSIFLIASLPEDKFAIPDMGPFQQWFYNDPIRILLICVIPLVLLLVANIVVLVTYIKKTSKPKKVTLDDLTEEQKEELRKKIAEELASK